MRQHDCVPQAAARAAVNIGAGAAPRRGPSLCIWLVERMRRCGRGAPTYPSFSLREASQRSEKSLMLSMKLASTRTLRARRSGTGPGRWVDLAYLKRSSTLRVTSGSAGRSSEAIFRHFWFPKTKRTLHRSDWAFEHSGLNFDQRLGFCLRSQRSATEGAYQRITDLGCRRGCNGDGGALA